MNIYNNGKVELTMGDIEQMQKRIAELEREKAELVANLKAYRKLTDRMSALMVKHKKVFTDKEISNAKQHLNQIKVEAGEAGFVAGFEMCQSNMPPPWCALVAVNYKGAAEQYAERIAKGE